MTIYDQDTEDEYYELGTVDARLYGRCDEKIRDWRYECFVAAFGEQEHAAPAAMALAERRDIDRTAVEALARAGLAPAQVCRILI